MPRATISAGTPSISMITATAAPAPKSTQGTGWRLMNPSTSAFMIEACGDTSTGRGVAGSRLAELEGLRERDDHEADHDRGDERPVELDASPARPESSPASSPSSGP